jgi:hypothetical protein
VHAGYLAFNSPIDGRLQEFTVPLPPELELVVGELRGEGAR